MTELSIPVEYSAILPELALTGGALVILVLSSLLRSRGAGTYVLFTLAAVAVALGGAWDLWNRVHDTGPFTGFAGAVVIDGFAVFFAVLVAVAVALGALLADPYLKREGLDGPEFYVLLLLSAAGGSLMAKANDLIVLFLGLEMLSIAMYVLAGYHRRRFSSREAAMKYFLLGSFSSAILLYGIALVYGATGSTALPAIGRYLAGTVITSNAILLAGLFLLLVGLAFKVGAVPFHMWTPDVYQGAPSPSVGFMAAVAKAAGFAALLRVFFSTFSMLQLDWQPVVTVLAILSIVVGSVLAIAQSDVKRMLAYSSISHAGYVLVGLQAATSDGIAGSLYYLFAYTFMVIGAFAIVTVVGRKGDSNHDLDHYRGLSTARPALALGMTVLLLAQAGIPFTTGFWAKFYVIAAAVDAGSYALAIIAMLFAVVAAFFYLRLVVVMYSSADRDVADGDVADGDLADGDGAAGADARPRLAVAAPVGAVLAITVVFTVAAGILPQPVLDFARNATLVL